MNEEDPLKYGERKNYSEEGEGEGDLQSVEEKAFSYLSSLKERCAILENELKDHASLLRKREIEEEIEVIKYRIKTLLLVYRFLSFSFKGKERENDMMNLASDIAENKEMSRRTFLEKMGEIGTFLRRIKTPKK
jgi:hypothetical protein